MGRLSDATANNLLDTRFGLVANSAPATYYVALSTTAPTNTGGGVTEPVGGGYARVAVANTVANWPAASARSKSNGNPITFPAPTGAWGAVTHFALYDAAAGGVFCGWGAFASGTTISSGGTAPVIPAGGLVINSPGV